jgi:hypothetical protein
VLEHTADSGATNELHCTSKHPVATSRSISLNTRDVPTVCASRSWSGCCLSTPHTGIPARANKRRERRLQALARAGLQAPKQVAQAALLTKMTDATIVKVPFACQLAPSGSPRARQYTGGKPKNGSKLHVAEFSVPLCTVDELESALSNDSELRVSYQSVKL